MIDNASSENLKIKATSAFRDYAYQKNIFNNDIKRIIINHSYAIKLSKYDLYENINLSDYFDSAHDSNKSVLLNLLSEGTQKLIGLI